MFQPFKIYLSYHPKSQPITIQLSQQNRPNTLERDQLFQSINKERFQAVVTFYINNSSKCIPFETGEREDKIIGNALRQQIT